MIADLVNEDLACDARGESYRYGTITMHLEKQMQEIYDHAEFCKAHADQKHHRAIDEKVIRYERKLATATNVGHRLMLYRNAPEKFKRNMNYYAELQRNIRRYAALDRLAEEMFPPPLKCGMAVSAKA